METEVLKVRNDTNVQLLAGAIAKVMQKKNGCEISCIGAAAVNQAVKGIAIARSMVATTGYDLVARCAFDTINMSKEGGKEEVTAIRFVLLLI